MKVVCMFRTRTHPSAHTLAQPLAHTKACTQTCAEANAQACTHACTPARSSCARLRWDAAFQHMWNEKPNNCKARLSCLSAPTRCVPLCVCARVCVSLCPCICLRVRVPAYRQVCAHYMHVCACLHVHDSVVARCTLLSKVSCCASPHYAFISRQSLCAQSMAHVVILQQWLAVSLVFTVLPIRSALQQWLADWLSKTSASEAPPAAAATLASSDTGGQRTEAERPQR